MNKLTDRITIDPDVCNGKPIIRGKRIAVQTVLEFLSSGDTRAEVLEEYPSLEMEDINACLAYASEVMNRKYVIQTIAWTNTW